MESPTLAPSQASQANPGLVANPALGLLPGSGQLPLGTLLMHLSGVSLESRKRHRTQLRLDGHRTHVVSGENKMGFSLDSVSAGSSAGWLSLCPAPAPPPPGSLSRSRDLDSRPSVGGELPGTVQ